MNEVAYDIYQFAYNTFFGKSPKQVMYRVNYVSKGAEQLVLDYIWFKYIEPHEDNNEDKGE